VAKALEAQGYKSGSVSSLLGQMLKQGMMRESAHLLYVTTSEYAPLKSSKALKVAQEKAQQTARKKVVLISKRTGEVIPPASAGIAALPTTREAAPQINSAWDAETLLNNLSIKQARALYDELRKIFGG
jgi:CelD/BcsL family acetyltransferase involved in cellulose biosynthesis